MDSESIKSKLPNVLGKIKGFLGLFGIVPVKVVSLTKDIEMKIYSLGSIGFDPRELKTPSQVKVDIAFPMDYNLTLASGQSRLRFLTSPLDKEYSLEKMQPFNVFTSDLASVSSLLQDAAMQKIVHNLGEQGVKRIRISKKGFALYVPSESVGVTNVYKVRKKSIRACLSLMEPILALLIASNSQE